MKKALITGIAGQDGSYLAELLLSKGYEVYGVDREQVIVGGNNTLKNIANIYDKISLAGNSLSDADSVKELIGLIRPDECYHLAGSTFVEYSPQEEFSVLRNNITGVHYLLAAIKEISPLCRFFFAGSSEMFGTVEHSPQNEDTPFNPRSIYGISKAAGYHLIKYYRDYHGLFACSGILYNHESTRRGKDFVTKKIVSTAVKIKLGMEKILTLGNMDAARDWGYALDYVNAMHLMLQKENPEDYVLASGELHTVKELVEIVFSHLSLDPHKCVKTDPELFRPLEKIPLVGNPAKAEKNFKWHRTKSFREMIIEMIEYEIALFTYPK